MTWLGCQLKGWRTVAFGACLSAASAMLDLLNAVQAVDIAPLLPPEHALKIMTAIGLVTVLLRLVTTGRVGEKA